MKITKSENNLKIANEIILMITDREDEMATSGGDTLTLKNGNLSLFHSACGIDDDEQVLMTNIQCDSFGDGWEKSTPEQMLEALNTLDAVEA